MQRLVTNGMKRRDFLFRSVVASVTAATLRGRAIAAANPFDPTTGPWRTFEVTTSVTLAPGKTAKAWIPIPSFSEPSWMKPGDTLEVEISGIGTLRTRIVDERV